MSISAVVNLHREGRLAHYALSSAWRAVEHARGNGIAAKLLILLDRPDASTVEAADRWRDRGVDVRYADVGDLGAARNRAVELSTAEWIAFLDGDDLWGEQWLSLAYDAATSNPDASTLDVWHPEKSVVFGDHQSIIHHHDSASEQFSWARFRLHNAWTALCFVSRANAQALPYPRNELADGFGYEDWSWNVEVLRRGGRHRVVPNTVHAIRRLHSDGPDSSLLTQSVAALRTIHPAATAEPAPIPGATVAISELTETDPSLPATHRLLRLDLSAPAREQLQRLSTLDPAVEWVNSNDAASTVAQNTNLHVTPEQRALEEVDLLAALHPNLDTRLANAELLPTLQPSTRARVVAQVLLETGQGSNYPSSKYVDEAITHFPQLTALL